jgi:hypothetical protein
VRLRHRPAIDGALVGIVAGALAGCPSLKPFACEGDDDCDRGGAMGTCLDDSVCAYPSDACDSGLVRSPNAPEDPGECVPAEATSSASSGSSASSPTGGASSSSLGDTGPQPACGDRVPLQVDVDFLSTTEVLEGYPLLVAISDATVVGAVVDAGTPPLFVTTDGSALASDIERIDADAIVAWVRLPAYALGEPLAIEMHFGPDIVADDPTAVWTGSYVGVWHMDEAPSGVDGDEIRNSAAPSEPALTVGGMTAEQSVPGVFGRGLDFDGADDALEIHADFVGTLDSYALSMWLRYDGNGNRGHYFYRLNGDTFFPRCWRFGENQKGGDDVFCQYQLEGGEPTSLITNTQQAPGQLVHLAVMRDARTSVHRVYIDGEQTTENMDPEGAALVSGDLPMLLGRGEDEFSLDGMIDEVRVSSAPISATWIRADYRTQLDPAAVVTITGPIEPIAGCASG